MEKKRIKMLVVISVVELLLASCVGRKEFCSYSLSLRRIKSPSEENEMVSAIVNPLSELNRFSMQAVHEALTQMEEVTSIGAGGKEVRYEDFAFMIKLSAEANVVDYNTPDMVALRTNLYEAGRSVREQLEVGGRKTLSINLGGEYWLHQFYERYVASGEAYTISILPDNNGQGMVTLKLADVCLMGNPNLRIYFIPKRGQHTNDLSFDDTLSYLEYDLNSDTRILRALVPDTESGETNVGIMDAEGRIYRLKVVSVNGQKKLVPEATPVSETGEKPRFIILEDGPQVQGLNPSQLSVTTVRAIEESDTLITEGQAFAEIRGWKKPVFLSFMMKG
ncbi:MAG TPA: hypothetical protein ENF97_00505, partial [Candidatus Omnitrophica bacterium]|nr:hypothetical protein [Candidatus Omnitrophota bacterium]